MASRITDNDDVIEYGLVTYNEVANLTTDAMEADVDEGTIAWETLHKRGWTKILDLLALRPEPIEEDDLDDTDELIPATVFMVLHYAYSQAEFMSDEMQARAKLYWDRAVQELNEVRLTVNGGTSERSAYSFRRARRM